MSKMCCRLTIAVNPHCNKGAKCIFVSAASDMTSEIKTKIRDLLKVEGDLDDKITVLRAAGVLEDEKDDHINKLHEYNEIKDIGQIVLGQLAVLERVTVKELYGKFGLEIED